MSKIERDGRSFLMAYDHGIEHGPKDFDGVNVDPENILEMAEKGPFTGISLQKGLAEKYYSSYDVPLVLKLNGKTKLNPKKYSPLNCSVEKALNIGADAVGYTLYPGSKQESEMQREFRKVQEKARENDLPVILWSYPRGKGIDETNSEIVAYASRIALELGADYANIKYSGSRKSFRWAVDNAGEAKVLCTGGSKKDREEFLEQVRNVMDAGAAGMSVGRNVWQREEPVKFSKDIADIIFG